jgi:large subunit ribosomal protein L3
LVGGDVVLKMLKSFFGLKKEMTSRYDRAGRRWPVTLISVPGCVVTQIKTEKGDGYWGVQVGFGEKKVKNISDAVKGHLRKAGLELAGKGPAFLGEEKMEGEGDLSGVNLSEIVKVGQVLTEGDIVAVTGVSKGKGFAGVVKRHGFSGGPKTHGQSDRHRAPGSIGSGTDPGRVWPGQSMAGRMGGGQVTVKNLLVVRIDDEKGEVWVRGAVPGRRGTVLRLVKVGVEKEWHPILTPGESFSVAEAAEEQEQMEKGMGQTEGGDGDGETLSASNKKGGEENDKS